MSGGMISDTVRDTILADVTRVREVLPAIVSVAEAVFPAEALEIAGGAVLLDKLFELVVKLSANAETLDALKARMRADTLAEIRALDPGPAKAP